MLMDTTTWLCQPWVRELRCKLKPTALVVVVNPVLSLCASGKNEGASVKAPSKLYVWNQNPRSDVLEPARPRALDSAQLIACDENVVDLPVIDVVAVAIENPGELECLAIVGTQVNRYGFRPDVIGVCRVY